jgi:hypothetical protein
VHKKKSPAVAERGSPDKASSFRDASPRPIAAANQGLALIEPRKMTPRPKDAASNIVLSPLVGPLEFGSLEHLKFISDLPPLIDEVQVHHTDCVILARKRTMVTLYCLLSTVFDPANHPSQH